MFIAFLIWAAAGLLFIGIGIFDFFSKKQAGFWANAKPVEVKDVKKYNRAVGSLFCVFGAVFILFGLPFLGSENSPLVFLPMVGIPFEVMAMMLIYVTVIEKKHRK